MRIGLCQIPVSPDPSVNLSRVRAALDEAARGGAALAVFPEATMVRFGSDLRAAAEPLDGPFCAGVAAACAATGVAAVAGVFEPAPDGRVYNTAVAFSGSGSLVASYRKLHLFDALGQRESDLVAPGSVPVIAELAGSICRVADLLRHPVSRTVPRAGGRRRAAARGQRGLAGRVVQGRALGDVAARPGDREHRVGRRRRCPDPDSPPTRAPKAWDGRCSSTRSAWSAPTSALRRVLSSPRRT